MIASLKKIGVPLLSSILGGTVVWAGIKYVPKISRELGVTQETQPRIQRHFPAEFDELFERQKELQLQMNSMFSDDFFEQRDPFAEMRKSSTGSLHEIEKREDDSYIYYEIKVEDLNLTSLNTKIEHGQINITGSIEKKSESTQNGNFQSYFKSSFARSFPLPEGVDTRKMETIPEKDKITLKFPKLKS